MVMQFFWDCITYKIKALGSFETSVIVFQSKRRNKLQDWILSETAARETQILQLF